MGKLRDRVAIVTGAGRGIGAATAVALANQGAHIVLAAKTSQEIETVANRVRTIGRQALAVPTDVSKKEQVDTLAAEAYQAFGHVDILVNNAGVAIHNPIPKIELSDWQTTLDVNLTGVFLCTQAVFENMCQQKSGHIINVSSTAGVRAGAEFGSYSASKFGVIGFTQSTFAEGKRHGVKAYAVCPGATDTKMRRDNHIDDLSKLSQPEDVADLIVFLVTQPHTAHILETVITTPLM